MKTLYLDLGMGAAGDMLAAALLELLPEPQAFIDRFNALGIPGVTVSMERAEKCGIHGTRFRVLCDGVEEDEHLHEHHHEHDHHDHEHDHDHEHHHHDHDHDHEHHHHHHDHDHHDHEHHQHHHSSLHHIEHIVGDMKLSAAVEADVLAVYRSIAEAESAVHATPVSDIHFHEVGTMDAVADVTAVCLLMRELGVDEVVASPIHVGSGTVHCAHGVLPVPAPATALLLKGVPIYGGAIQSELCTPTGAALVRHFATRFGEMPLMTPDAIGYGMGKKDFEQANCVRAILGETAGESESIVQLQCNVDDMTGEAMGFALERIYEAGAVEAFTVPAGMKKNRPGVLLTVLCHEDARTAVTEAIFRHTSTIGVREAKLLRHVLTRCTETVETPLGAVRVKRSTGCGVTKRKWEYDDLARLARERGVSLAELERLLGMPNADETAKS